MTSIKFQIRHGNGILKVNDIFSYDNQASAIYNAKTFKENPRVFTPKMDIDSVEYWKKQTFEVIKIVETIDVLAVI